MTADCIRHAVLDAYCELYIFRFRYRPKMAGLFSFSFIFRPKKKVYFSAIFILRPKK